MKIREIMTKDLVTVKPQTSANEAARMMRDANIGDVLVTNGDRLLGILTDRDIVVRIDAQGMDTKSAPVGDFMSPDPFTVSADADVEEAAQLMAQRQIRRLPVLENGRLAGIVSLGDVATDTMASGAVACSPACSALDKISQPSEPRIGRF